MQEATSPAVLRGGPHDGTECEVSTQAERVVLDFVGPALPWTYIVGPGVLIYVQADQVRAGRQIYEYVGAMPKQPQHKAL